MNYSDIVKELSNFQDKNFEGGVSLIEIERAEFELESILPLDYKEFLLKMGCGYVSSEEFIGLGTKLHINVIDVTHNLRKQSTHANFPVGLVPIMGDGYGNYDCIDTRNSDDLSKSNIIEWVHDAKGNTQYKFLAVGYWEWFEKILNMIKSLDDE